MEDNAPAEQPQESAATDAQDQNVDSSPISEQDSSPDSVDIDALPAEQPTADVDGNVDLDADENASVPLSRFQTVYYKQKAAERELEELRQQQQQQTQQVANQAPSLEDFDYDEAKYTDAVIDFKLKQRESEMKKQQANSEQDKKYQNFAAKQHSYIKDNPRYQDLTTIADASGIKFGNTLTEAILNSDQGVQIHHHLLSNPEKLDEMLNASSYQVAKTFVELENKFKPKSKQKQKAFEPLSKQVPSAAPKKVGLTEMGKMTPDEYYRWKMSQ